MVFDNDIQGEENEEVLKSILNMLMRRSEQEFNFTLIRRTNLATEQQEPCSSSCRILRRQ